MANITQKIPKKDSTDKRVVTNKETIKQAVLDYITEHKGKKAPTTDIIAQITGLSYKTVQTYFKELDFKTMVTPMRALTPLVLNNIYNLSHKSVSAQKLWMQVVEGWNERLDLNVAQDIQEIKVEIIENRLKGDERISE